MLGKVQTSNMEETAIHPNFPGYVFNRNGTMIKKNGKETLGSLQDTYYVVFIKDKDGLWSKQRVHRLIMEAFSGEPPGDREVDHLNMKTLDNSYSNLRYMTKLEHRRRTYLENPSHVEKSGEKRGKKIIGFMDLDVMHFSTIRMANEFLDLDKNSGVISKAIKENGTVCGWSFKYAIDEYEGEEWKTVDNYKGLTSKISVSNFGRIKTDRCTSYGNLCNGYFKLSMNIDGRRCDKMVHTMVCWAFHGPTPEGFNSVNHKDRNTQNNRPENLEWSNPKMQGEHKSKTPPYVKNPDMIASILTKKVQYQDEDENDENKEEEVDDDIDSYEATEDTVYPPLLFSDPEYTHLQNDLMAVLNKTYTDLNESTFKCKYPLSWYEEKVFSECTLEAVLNADIEIEPVSNQELRHLWKFFQAHTSSNATSKTAKRVKDFLVKDKISSKYIGIISLGSDAYSLKARDTFIGWDRENHERKMVNVINIRTCVGLQPVSYNFNIGELLTSLCFSKEVLGDFQKVYSDPIAAITTSAINDQVQYDKLKCIKFIGFSNGYGCDHIPKGIYDRACAFVKKYNLTQSHRSKIQLFGKLFKLPTYNLQVHCKKRQVYLGYTGNNAVEFLTQSNVVLNQTLSSVANIVSKWKQKWAIPRYNYLIESNCLKQTAIEWTTPPIEPSKDIDESYKKGKIQVYKSAPKEKVVYKRPSIQNVPKATDQKFAIALSNAVTARQKSGMTDETIDKVRQLLAEGVMNKTIQTQLDLTKSVITNIKRGITLKLSEMDTDSYKEKYSADVETPKKSPKPEHKQPGRRKITNPKFIEVLKYLVDHPMSVLELTDKCQELFEISITAAVATNVLRGKTRLDEVEFPIGNTTWNEYTDMLNTVINRDYTALAWQYKRSLKAKAKLT